MDKNDTNPEDISELKINFFGKLPKRPLGADSSEDFKSEDEARAYMLAELLRILNEEDEGEQP